MLHASPPPATAEHRAMTSTPSPYLLQGPFNFLRPDPEEIRALAPDIERWYPRPGVSFLEDESATPVRGFPILVSAELDRPCAPPSSGSSPPRRRCRRRCCCAAPRRRQALQRRLGALPRPAGQGGRERHHLQLRPQLPRRLLAPALARRRPPAQGDPAPGPAATTSPPAASTATPSSSASSSATSTACSPRPTTWSAGSPTTPRRSRRSCSRACCRGCGTTS